MTMMVVDTVTAYLCRMAWSKGRWMPGTVCICQTTRVKLSQLLCH